MRIILEEKKPGRLKRVDRADKRDRREQRRDKRDRLRLFGALA
jgi:hypothetical protein